MAVDEKVIGLIFNVVDEINQQLSKNNQLKKSTETILFGKSGILDSLGLVNFIVSTEQKIEEEFGTAISLTDEKAMSQKNSPFKSIGTLADYIISILKVKRNE